MKHINKIKSKLYYQGHKVTVYTDEPIRIGECQACHKKVGEGIKFTQLHHYRYAYRWETVKKNPVLALAYTIELCFYCHRIADAVRMINQVKNTWRTYDVLSVLPSEAKETFNSLILFLMRVEVNSFARERTD